MAHIDLNEEQKAIFISILENDLSDLRMEIADTHHSDYKEELKKKKEVLISVIESMKKF